MLSKKLVSQIEERADQLGNEVLERLTSDAKTPAYHQLPEVELHRIASEVLRHLGLWLNSRSDAAIESYYHKIGMSRRHSGIPLSQVIRAQAIVKNTLLRFIRNSMLGGPEETPLEAELLASISEFFDSAIYGAAVGYEEAERAASQPTPERAEGSAATMPVNAAEPVKAEELDWDPTSRAGEIGEVSG